MRYLKMTFSQSVEKSPVNEIKVTHIKNLLDDIWQGALLIPPTNQGLDRGGFDYSAMLEISENNPARLLKNHIPNLLHQT